MATPRPRFDESVFINCPFEESYWPIFEAIVYCIISCRFVARCALEEIDLGQFRLQKIQQIIKGSRYAVHDLSRIELSPSGFPRFNMPFELGLDLGCRAYGHRTQRTKQCLILEAEPYRYQAFLSDIAGQDI